MFLEKDNLHRVLLLFTGLVTAVLGVMIGFVPPSADPDPSWGFLVMHGMEQGHPFNLLLSPDPQNIAASHAEFLSWWSPGQYLMPYFFKVLFRLNTGHAVALTVALCNIAGLAGFYQLFKKLGFTRWISAISVAFIASQQFFILPYTFYTGGEVLLFAFAGWFLYGCFSFDKISWQSLLFVFGAGLLGFFSKSSALWIYAAGVACMWINNCGKQEKLWIWLRKGILLAIPVICSLAVIYIFYLSKGDNPTKDSNGWMLKPETFSFPLASPLLAGFSVDELFSGLIYHPDGPQFPYTINIIILLVLAAASLVFIIAVPKLVPGKNYSLALIVVYIVGCVFFSYLYLKQAPVSYEGRHFRVIGLLAIPGVIYLLKKTKITRFIFVAIWVAFICWGYRYFKAEYRCNSEAPVGPSGLSQQLYDHPTLDALCGLDQAHHGDAVFVVVSPDIADEVSNNGVITLDIEDMSKQDFKELRYAGKTGPVYIFMPKNYAENGVAQGVCNSFVNYRKFTATRLSPAYYLYTAEN